VAAGKVDPEKAWPEYFGKPGDTGAVPAVDADMTEWEWEQPTEKSFRADMAAMNAVLRESGHLVMAEPPGPPPEEQRAPVVVDSVEWG
jgi:hypothetical protein